MRSITGDDAMRSRLPWADVIVDVQGPYTKAEGGERYVLSYHCTALKVPRLEAFASLQAGHFSRALVSCVLRSRIIPDVARTDRGPEMTSAVDRECLALCGAKHLTGSAFTPRRQGPGERAHQAIMTYHLLLTNAVCRASPQEWASLAPALEYLMETDPRPPFWAFSVRPDAGVRLSIEHGQAARVVLGVAASRRHRRIQGVACPVSRALRDLLPALGPRSTSPPG